MGNETNLMEQISEMLSDNPNLSNNIKGIINNFSENATSKDSPDNSNQNNNIQNSNNENPFNNIDFDMILKAKKIADSMSSNNDPRKNLLLSLKPYLKEEKRDKIDQYIQFLSLSKIFEEFGPELFGSGKNDKWYFK